MNSGRYAHAARVSTALGAQVSAERSAAIRALLAVPLMTDSDRDYIHVATHAGWLTEWFSTRVGWSLVVDSRDGFARLRKVCPDSDATRPALTARSSPGPFNRRRYALLCAAAAALYSSDRDQVSLAEIAQRVTALTASSPTVPTYAPADPGGRGERVALVDAVALLVRHGILTCVGTQGDYASAAGGNALYDVHTRRLAQLLVTRRPPSLTDHRHELFTAPALLDVDDPDVAPAAASPRHTAMRALLDDPVVYFKDLDDAAAAYLSSSGGWSYLHASLTAAGFTVERRAEGVAVIDVSRRATDVTFPDDPSTLTAASLHVAAACADAVAPERRQRSADDISVSSSMVVDVVTGLLNSHRSWAANYRTDDGSGARRLAADCVDLLVKLGMLARIADSDRLVVRPGIARLRPVNSQGSGSGSGPADSDIRPTQLAAFAPPTAPTAARGADVDATLPQRSF